MTASVNVRLFPPADTGSAPGMKAGETTALVTTTQIAPTILRALGLDPQALEAVRQEHTQGLVGLGF